MSSPAEVQPLPGPGPGPATDALLDGRYLLRKVIGKGGFATVYAAHDRKIASPVAVKLLHEWCGEPERRRFNVEVVISGRMNHPHIIRMTDSGEHEGRPYAVMPLLTGGTLSARRGEHWRTIARLMRQYLEGLRALHEASAFVDPEHRTRVLHRDIKPSNCFVSNTGHLTILDLGLIKAIDMPLRATTAGTLVGSTAYMAPECLLLAERATERTDVYSLGVTFFEMLTGERPYQGCDVAEIRKQLATRGSAPNVRALRPEIPAPLAELVQRAMAPLPVDRPATVAAMLATLDTVLVRSNAWDPSLGSPPRVRIQRAAPVVGVLPHAMDLSEHNSPPANAPPANAVVVPLAVPSPRRSVLRAAGLGVVGIGLVVAAILGDHAPHAENTASPVDTARTGVTPDVVPAPPFTQPLLPAATPTPPDLGTLAHQDRGEPHRDRFQASPPAWPTTSTPARRGPAAGLRSKPALTESVVLDVMNGAAARLRACPDVPRGWIILDVHVRGGRASLQTLGFASAGTCARAAVAALRFPTGSGDFKVSLHL